MKLQIDSERCQGHGRCYDLAPGLFGDDDEGYGKVLGDGVVPPAAENDWWYQYYFCTERGVLGLTEYRYEFGEFVWKFNSPTWNSNHIIAC